MKNTETSLTALHLLHGFLDLHILIPDLEDWSEDHVHENPPALIRLRRLKALFQAFGIKWDPTAFRNGDFLCMTSGRYDPVESRYKPLLNNLQMEMPGPKGWISRLSQLDLILMFKILIDYREELESALSLNECIYAATGPALYAVRKTEEFNHAIRSYVPGIDSLLTSLIDPQSRTFPLSQLVREFGYPEEDLEVVDAEWY